MLKVCEKCGAAYNAPPTKAKRFCSKECAGNLLTPVIVQCQQCGIDIQTVPALINRKRFCSKECQAKYQSVYRRLNYTCTICNSVFQSPGDGSGARKYCSIECANVARGIASANRDSRETRPCEICQKPMRVFPSRHTRYCSRACGNIGKGITTKGKIRTSQIVQCGECGKDIKRYKSREGYNQKFCNRECYAKWDSKYKTSIEWLSKGSKKSSKIEDIVADFLDMWGVSYERQYALKHYVIDFKVGTAIVEVQGCYWHACPVCFPEPNPRHKDRRARDKALATYCRNRGIPLYQIWEHDIRKGDLSILFPLIQL